MASVKGARRIFPELVKCTQAFNVNQLRRYTGSMRGRSKFKNLAMFSGAVGIGFGVFVYQHRWRLLRSHHQIKTAEVVSSERANHKMAPFSSTVALCEGLQAVQDPSAHANSDESSPVTEVQKKKVGFKVSKIHSIDLCYVAW